MWACVLLGFAAVAVGSVPAAVYSNGYSTPYLQMPLDSEVSLSFVANVRRSVCSPFPSSASSQGFVQSFLLNEVISKFWVNIRVSFCAERVLSCFRVLFRQSRSFVNVCLRFPLLCVLKCVFQTNLWRPFFETYGIVVIRDLFTAQECDETVGEMWSSLRHLGFREDDPSTWDRMPWGAHLGFLGNHAVLSPKACANRQQENLYHFHRLLYETDHLVVSVDRLGWIRPTRGVNGTPDHTEWRSVKNWLHWDMNPYTGSTSTYAYQGNYPENPHNKVCV